MTTEKSAKPIQGIGKAGVMIDGQIIHFELIFRGGREQFVLDLDTLNTLLLALETLMHDAVTERAKRPGFDSSQYSLKLAPKWIRVGRATSRIPSDPPHVAIEIVTGVGSTLALVLSAEEAQQCGTQLISESESLGSQPPRKLS
jgi:hypothetical protein